jgi:hypothetical protein
VSQLIGPDGWKELARERGVTMRSLAVLEGAADPFFCGTPAQRRDGELFAEPRRAHGGQVNTTHRKRGERRRARA